MNVFLRKPELSDGLNAGFLPEIRLSLNEKN